MLQLFPISTLFFFYLFNIKKIQFYELISYFKLKDQSQYYIYAKFLCAGKKDKKSTRYISVLVNQEDFLEI